MDHNQDRRRGHLHRGRRGSDRRGFERRAQPSPPERPGRDQVDVEQIMRDIRARIAQRRGIDLSREQIQDLAARRLESILDPRVIKSSLLHEFRRTAADTVEAAATKPANEPAYSFDDTTIYESHRGILRVIRKILNPLLKLFFNPNPLIRALHLQAQLNVETAERQAERDRIQAEWNALHYDILQRVVTEISRVSLELQSLSTRVESLNARVDFNDRRVREVEGSLHRATPADAPPRPAASEPGSASQGVPDALSGDARRRRRRRRGRRSGMLPSEPGHAPAPLMAPTVHTEGAPDATVIERETSPEAVRSEEPTVEPASAADSAGKESPAHSNDSDSSES